MAHHIFFHLHEKNRISLQPQKKFQTGMINVIIVDDLDYVIDGIQMSIENRHSDLCVVGTAKSGKEFFELLKTVEADIVLLDIVMPGGMDGIEVARRLKKERPEMKILAFSAESSQKVVKEMLEAGIDGFIGKLTAGTDEFAEAIRSIMQDINYFGRDISHIMFNTYVSKTGTTEITAEFTEQEKRIIELCREKLPAKLIADRLNISTKTVNNHKNNIFKKLGINSTTEMVQYALKMGIIRME